MNPKLQYAMLAGMFLVGLGTSIQGLHAWQEAYSTSFIGGTAIQMGTVILAVFVKGPNQGNGQ